MCVCVCACVYARVCVCVCAYMRVWTDSQSSRSNGLACWLASPSAPPCDCVSILARVRTKSFVLTLANEHKAVAGQCSCVKELVEVPAAVVCGVAAADFTCAGDLQPHTYTPIYMRMWVQWLSYKSHGEVGGFACVYVRVCLCVCGSSERACVRACAAVCLRVRVRVCICVNMCVRLRPYLCRGGRLLTGMQHSPGGTAVGEQPHCVSVYSASWNTLPPSSPLAVVTLSAEAEVDLPCAAVAALSASATDRGDGRVPSGDARGLFCASALSTSPSSPALAAAPFEDATAGSCIGVAPACRQQGPAVPPGPQRVRSGCVGWME